MELVPSYLTFDLSLESPLCSLKLKNTSDEPRVFAIKTTNLLGTYRFKPNKGVLLKNESITFVAYLSEAKCASMIQSKEFRCRDDFLVLSSLATEEFLHEYTSLATDQDEKKFLVDEYLKTSSPAPHVGKLLFSAVFIPPPKSTSSLQQTAVDTPTVAGFLAGCLRPIVRLSDGSVRLSTQDLVVNVSKRTPSPIVIHNRCEYYVVYAVTAAVNERFKIEPWQHGLIGPREDAALHISLLPEARENVLQNLPSSLDASETFLVMATTVTDPDFIDRALNASETNDKDKLFEDFWTSGGGFRATKKNLWKGSFKCTLTQETPSSLKTLTRRLSSQAMIGRTKSAILERTNEQPEQHHQIAATTSSSGTSATVTTV